jgi:hypothetical protein
VNDGPTWNVLVPVFSNEAAMAVFGGWFGAQKTRSTVAGQDIASDLFSLSSQQKQTKIGLVGWPIGILTIGLKDLRGWRKINLMLVSDGEPLPEQEGQIVPFRVAGQVRCITQADIDHRVHTRLAQLAYEHRERFTSVANSIKCCHTIPSQKR